MPKIKEESQPEVGKRRAGCGRCRGQRGSPPLDGIAVPHGAELPRLPPPGAGNRCPSRAPLCGGLRGSSSRAVKVGTWFRDAGRAG